MTKFKAKGNETMTWLDEAHMVVSFVDGIAEIEDKAVIAEMTKRGFKIVSEPNTSTPKTTSATTVSKK